MSFLDKLKSVFSAEEKREELKEEIKKEAEKIEDVVEDAIDKEEIILAPITGEAKDIKECVDPVFAQEIVGKGVIIIPSEGKVFAPVDGKVSMLAETGHAVGITSTKGTDLLIHVGLDTVELEGKPFTIRVASDDEVKCGDLLIEFDIEQIKAAGKEIQSPVIVTNAEGKTIDKLNIGQVSHGADLLKLS
ncbi:PTS glucose transporter subunit IIA [uncultured Anaerococcus sp.]|uniref:PTS sugar transporter subunit IIA n=1 Tax=uncultured Anaerococcus sp. TaxID=293428 RepID=UPI0026077C54|nr:PTS glucose transporter subunit IIA [uncultured Anaerococcus sp.]